LGRKGVRGLRDKESLDAFRDAVLGAAEYRCERCGSPRGLNAHHRFPRGRGGADHSINGAALCAGDMGCHMRVHRHEVDDWADWLVDKPTRWDRMYQRYLKGLSVADVASEAGMARQSVHVGFQRRGFVLRSKTKSYRWAEDRKGGDRAE